MDVASDNPNGDTFILFHGKNFNGFYWKEVIMMLSKQGYRVIVPDQIGFGESDKPELHYSFHQMATDSKRLLDSLHITKVNVIGHSMGGMLAPRFTLMFPETVQKLILENPIGLEDYRKFVPYTLVDSAYKQELAATYESYKKYQQSYYPEWKPEYESLVIAQAKSLKENNFPQTAKANALTYEMIYEQPVCYEFADIKVPTLLIIGQEDRTIVGKAKLSKEDQKKYGQYPQLGRSVHEQIKNSKLVELKGIGHVPHIQDIDAFTSALQEFMKEK